MQKLLITLAILITTQCYQLQASYKTSCCKRFTERLLLETDLFVARNLERKSDQTILSYAAAQKNPELFKYCLEKNIGSINSFDAEGHSPKSIAMLLNNEEIVELITKKNN